MKGRSITDRSRRPGIQPPEPVDVPFTANQWRHTGTVKPDARLWVLGWWDLTAALGIDPDDQELSRYAVARREPRGKWTLDAATYDPTPPDYWLPLPQPPTVE